MINGILIILVWMLLVPLGMGLLITPWLKNRTDIFIKSYLFGMVLYLAAFQMIIITNMFTSNNFFEVCTVFSYVSVALAGAGFILAVAFMVKKKKAVSLSKSVDVSETDRKKKIENIVLWILFAGTLLFQLIQAVRLTFPDGDDAYYVGTASYGANMPQMYSRIPYTGATTEFDTRHCLAPFPYFIAFLGRLSGVGVSVIAHSILPLFFILFAYGIYYLIAREVCREAREVSLFMLIVSVLFMFGNYSVYSMETFMMTRIRQGKASLGSFVLPLGFYLLLMFAKNIEKNRQDKIAAVLLLASNGLVGALLTTMGNFIYPCMVVVGGLCVCLGKKKWKNIFWVLGACVPSGIMALMYFVIR